MKVAIYANDREVSEQVKQQLIEKLLERIDWGGRLQNSNGGF